MMPRPRARTVVDRDAPTESPLMERIETGIRADLSKPLKCCSTQAAPAQRAVLADHAPDMQIHAGFRRCHSASSETMASGYKLS